MNIRPYDYGDQYPSDASNTPPADPIDNVQVSEHSVDFIPARRQLSVIDKFDPKFDKQKTEQPVRPVFWGKIIAPISEEIPYTYSIILQNGRLVQAYKPNQLPTETFYVGEVVTVVLGQNDDYIIVGTTYSLFNAIQWAELSEDLLPGDRADAILLSFDGGWSTSDGQDISVYDPNQLNCKLAGERVQVTLMERQSCAWECVGSSGLIRKVTNSGSAWSPGGTRTLQIVSGSKSIPVKNDLYKIPASKDVLVVYDTTDNTWNAVQALSSFEIQTVDTDEGYNSHVLQHKQRDLWVIPDTDETDWLDILTMVHLTLVQKTTRYNTGSGLLDMDQYPDVYVPEAGTAAQADINTADTETCS